MFIEIFQVGGGEGVGQDQSVGLKFCVCGYCANGYFVSVYCLRGCCVQL